jgi:hypothetical protein
MPRRRRTALTLFALAVLASAVAGTATAASAPAYKARVNGICRTYTPTLKKLEADSASAKRAGDVHRISYDLGYGVALALREDAAIEAVPVPATLNTQMTPILRLFRKVDTQARSFLRYAQANDLTAAMTQMKRIQTSSAPADAMLDRAGLADCGSRQG